MKKEMKVSMWLTFNGTSDQYEELKRVLDHQIECLLNLDEFPEIKGASNVQMEAEYEI